jgi:hypothetical protein
VNCGRRNPPGALIVSARCFLLAALGLFSSHVLAQGCASCYTTAASGGPQTVHALRSGILLLLGPPVLILAGIMVVLRTWNGARREVNPLTTTESISHSGVGQANAHKKSDLKQ